MADHFKRPRLDAPSSSNEPELQQHHEPEFYRDDEAQLKALPMAIPVPETFPLPSLNINVLPPPAPAQLNYDIPRIDSSAPPVGPYPPLGSSSPAPIERVFKLGQPTLARPENLIPGSAVCQNMEATTSFAATIDSTSELHLCDAASCSLTLDQHSLTGSVSKLSVPLEPYAESIADLSERHSGLPSFETEMNPLVIPRILDQQSTFVDVSHEPTLIKAFGNLHSTGDGFVTLDTEVDEYFDAEDTIFQGEEPFESTHEEDASSRSANTEYVTAASSNISESQMPSTHHAPSCDPPIYKGAPITESESAVALLSLILSNHITGLLLSNILSFIQLLLPSDNSFFKTAYAFQNHFKFLKGPLNFIFYCCDCQQKLESKESVSERCGPSSKVGVYLHLPLIDQVKQLYAREGFTEKLAYRFSRSKNNSNNLEDIYDGELYKEAALTILASVLNISLMWNTDGISLYKSSKFQIWPFYFTINELPPHLRCKDENVLLVGLAFGYEKPNANLLLQPIHEELCILRRGIEVSIPHSSTPVKIQGIVLCGSCDAPAKSTFLRTVNFNGHYGCPRCLIKGKKATETGNVFVYPVQENIELRNKENYQEHLRLFCDPANTKSEPQFGIKGPSYLFYMVWSFFLTSTAVDAMHCVYLGVCRQLFYLWLSPDFIKKVFGENVDKKELMKILSKLFCDLSPPHYLNRAPRPLDHLKYFKASEFRTWLFNTALPVLEKHMKELYFTHLKKLVCGVALLNSESISPEDIALARELLSSFVNDFQELFGLRNMSFNVHCLLHLVEIVLLLGPLWVSTCFGLEGINGQLAELVHGTRYAGLQIHSNLGLLRSVSSLINSLPNGSAAKSFSLNMMSKGKRMRVSEKLDNFTKLVGNMKKLHILPPDFVTCLCRSASVVNGTNFTFFFRLKLDSFLYVSEDYGRGVRDSSCVMYRNEINDQCFGAIKVFVRITECQCDDVCNDPAGYFALIQKFDYSYPFTIAEFNATIKSIVSCSISEDIELVPIRSLQCVCFKMIVESSFFLSIPLNRFELE